MAQAENVRLVARRPFAWFRNLAIPHALLKAKFSEGKLPPGKLIRLGKLEVQNRHYLRERAEVEGPIFKGLSHDGLLVCVVGLDRCRRLLRDHASDLRTPSLNLTPLFPKGILRVLRGQDHLHYRRRLADSISGELVEANQRDLCRIVEDELARFERIEGPEAQDPSTLIQTLERIASGMLIQTFYGARFGSREYDDLWGLFHELGPNGVVWFIKEPQKAAFSKLRDYLQSDRHAVGRSSSVPNVLGRAAQQGELDETALGNLIYMVEMGRFDLHSLFRWMLKFATTEPALLSRIATADSSATGVSLEEAFVHETLRMEQSERLIRLATRDLIFDGYFIPKYTRLRFCVWESHKAADPFSDPLVFDPLRFIHHRFDSSQFSPFGLDQHRCPASNLVVNLSALFLRTLAGSYRLEGICDGPAHLGTYHWQPCKAFTVALTARPLQRDASAR